MGDMAAGVAYTRPLTTACTRRDTQMSDRWSSAACQAEAAPPPTRSGWCARSSPMIGTSASSVSSIAPSTPWVTASWRKVAPLLCSRQLISHGCSSASERSDAHPAWMFLAIGMRTSLASAAYEGKSPQPYVEPSLP